MSSATVPRRPALFMWAALVCFSTLLAGLALADMPEIAADMDSIGASGFSCEGKVIGGYYADVDSGCQMFHVCTLGQEGEIRDIKFLCLAGTIFDQETRVCERIDEVDCSESPKYYHLNLELFGRNGHILATGRKVPRGDSGVIDEEEEEEGVQRTIEDDYEDYEDDNRDVIREEFSEAVSTTTTTTVAPTTVSTTTVTSTSEATTTTTEPTTTTPQQNLQSIETIKPIQEPIFTPNLSPASEQQQPLIIHHDLSHDQSHVSLDGAPIPSVITIIRRPEMRTPSEIAEEEDLREILEQIEADVPRIQSIGRSASASLRFQQRNKRDDAATVSKRKRRPNIRRTEPAVAVRAALDDENFNCNGRVQGGFYADVPSGCRKFHICGLGKKSRVVTHTFTCGIGLAFDQATLTCQDIAKVDCQLSPSLYHLNDPAYRPDPEAVDTFQSFKEKSIGTAGTSYHVSYE